MHEIIRLARLYTSLDDLEHYSDDPPGAAAAKGTEDAGATARRTRDSRAIRWTSSSPGGRDHHRRSPPTLRRLGMEFSAAVVESGRLRGKRRATNPRAGFPMRPTTEAPPPEAGTESVGLPGSPGVAEGEVFVVSGPRDFAGLPPRSGAGRPHHQSDLDPAVLHRPRGDHRKRWPALPRCSHRP